MNAARIMWVASGQSDVLNSAAHGCTATVPVDERNPVGVFMNPFAATTKNADATPAIPIGTPLQRCTRGGKRSQP